MTRCPFCLELIKVGAYICKHCGRDFLPEFIDFYRPVLDEYPELRINTPEVVKDLEITVKQAYLLALTNANIDAKTTPPAATYDDSTDVKIVLGAGVALSFLVLLFLDS